MSVLPDVSSLLPNTFFYPLLFISLVLWYLHQRFQSSRLTTMVNKLPGPTALPLIGNLYQLIGRLRPPQLLQYAIAESTNYEKEGVVRFWLGPTKPVIGIFNPADIEVILSSNVHLDKSAEYRWFQPWLGDGLLINSGEKWRTHRKLIAPAFHLNVLKSFIPQFNSNAKRLVQRLRKEAERATEFDVHDYMSESTVDVLIETAMGVSTGHTGDKSGFEYAMAVMKMCDIVHQRAYKFWLRLDSLFQFSHFAKEQEGYLKTIHGLSNSVIKNGDGQRRNGDAQLAGVAPAAHRAAAAVAARAAVGAGRRRVRGPAGGRAGLLRRDPRPAQPAPGPAGRVPVGAAAARGAGLARAAAVAGRGERRLRAPGRPPGHLPPRTAHLGRQVVQRQRAVPARGGGPHPGGDGGDAAPRDGRAAGRVGPRLLLPAARHHGGRARQHLAHGRRAAPGV